MCVWLCESLIVELEKWCYLLLDMNSTFHAASTATFSTAADLKHCYTATKIVLSAVYENQKKQGFITLDRYCTAHALLIIHPSAMHDFLYCWLFTLCKTPLPLVVLKTFIKLSLSWVLSNSMCKVQKLYNKCRKKEYFWTSIYNWRGQIPR